MSMDGGRFGASFGETRLRSIAAFAAIIDAVLMQSAVYIEYRNFVASLARR
jgi:hypothetical protein